MKIRLYLVCARGFEPMLEMAPHSSAVAALIKNKRKIKTCAYLFSMMLPLFVCISSL